MLPLIGHGPPAGDDGGLGCGLDVAVKGGGGESAEEDEGKVLVLLAGSE